MKVSAEGSVKGGRMMQLIVALALISASQDSMPSREMIQSRYSRQVLVNSILGFTCTIGMGIFYAKGNDAYEDYKNSQSMSGAIEAWDRVRTNDTARNIFAVGAAFFLARAVYCQIKRANVPKTSSFSPVIDVRCAYQPKLIIGLQRSL
jgi:hypothetical protein